MKVEKTFELMIVTADEDFLEAKMVYNRCKGLRPKTLHS